MPALLARFILLIVGIILIFVGNEKSESDKDWAGGLVVLGSLMVAAAVCLIEMA